MLKDECKIDDDLISKLMSWMYFGYRVPSGVRIAHLYQGRLRMSIDNILDDILGLCCQPIALIEIALSCHSLNLNREGGQF